MAESKLTPKPVLNASLDLLMRITSRTNESEIGHKSIAYITSNRRTFTRLHNELFYTELYVKNLALIEREFFNIMTTQEQTDFNHYEEDEHFLKWSTEARKAELVIRANIGSIISEYILNKGRDV